jgi:Protein of unknown function (DUF3455)
MNTYRKRLLIALQLFSVAVLMVAGTTSALAQTGTTPSTQPPVADGIAIRNIILPPMPDNLQLHPEDGFTAFLVGHAMGTQNYVCKPTINGGFAFALFTPQATLFTDANKEIIVHFFSPNPDEANTDPTVVADFAVRATWQDSTDGSTVWAKVDKSSTDAPFVAKDAVAWLLLDVVGTRDGLTGGKTLSDALRVQRLNTSGGVAPKTGCSSAADVGKEAFVSYTADYFFYKKSPQ